MAVTFLGPGKRRSKGETNRIAVTVNGSMAGRPNRFPTGCRSTSPMTNPCASLTKPFTRLSISRAEVLSSASWLAVSTIADGALQRDEAVAEVTLTGGQVLRAHIALARGSLDRPMSDDELDAKFESQAAYVLTEEVGRGVQA
jgi:hypothetical protein